MLNKQMSQTLTALTDFRRRKNEHLNEEETKKTFLKKKKTLKGFLAKSCRKMSRK
jgi:hypothetical protein